MKVLLFNAISNCVKEKSVIPLGLLSIATFLTQNGHTVRIVDRTVERSSVKTNVKSFSPDIVGISVISSKSFDDGMKISRSVKKLNVPIVWGGLTPSFIPEIVLKSDLVDFVVVGEGEITLLELINAITWKTPLSSVDGLAYIENGDITLNKERTPVDLSMLPVIDFSFVNPEKYIVTNINDKRGLHTYSSKGCPCQCAYCYNPAFCKRLWRARPSEHYLSEIKYLLNNFKIDSIYFIDDLLSPNAEYTMNFCRRIAESGLKFFWGCDMRADVCTREELQTMYDAGCRWIFFGIESGSERMQEIIKKRLNLKKAKDTIAVCAEIGIVTTTSFIVGFPDEKQEDVEATVSFARSIKSDVKIAFSFGPIPKSEMYETLLKSNRLQFPQSYKGFSKIKWFDSFGKNYSEVPSRDFKVITSCFIFSIIRNKYDAGGSEKRTWVARLIRQAQSFSKRGMIKSLQYLAAAAKEFIEILFYATMFPKIRRKYALTYRTKTKD